jgi:glutathione S-transferase
MKLFDAGWAPSPRRVRIYLAEKGISVETEVVDLRGGAHYQPPYCDLNPRRQLPSLLLDDGTLIDDSVAICRYFEALHPDPPLFGHDAREIGLVEAWIRRIESDCYAAIVYAFRNRSPAFVDQGVPGFPGTPQIAELIDRGNRMWPVFVDALDVHLAANAWLAGEHFSFADIAAMVAIDFAVATRMPTPLDRPSISRWHEAAAARPSARA